jgi:hypothetical protein
MLARMPPRRLISEGDRATAKTKSLETSALPRDTHDIGLRSLQYSLPPFEEKLLLSQRASTWPLGADAKQRAIREGRIDDLLIRGDLAEPSVRPATKKKTRTRFSLPTIQELQTYERDPEFAKLEDRPKRGLNLPRSKSIKPSSMSQLLLDLDEPSSEDEFSRDPADSRSPMGSRISPRMKLFSTAQKSPASSSSSPSPVLPSPISSVTYPVEPTRRFADSPGTPIAASLQPIGRSKPGFFKSDI